MIFCLDWACTDTRMRDLPRLREWTEVWSLSAIKR